MIEIKIPTIEEIKHEASTYTIDDKPWIINDEIAADIQEKMIDSLPDYFSEFIRDALMDGEYDE